MPPLLPATRELFLGSNKIGDAGCAALAAALEGGALPALEKLRMRGNRDVSDAAREALYALRGMY